jgi:hypothetical protein
MMTGDYRLTGDNKCLHSFEIKLLVPRNSLSVGIQALADVDADKQFMLTLENVWNGAEPLDAREMNWSYSKALERAFAYVPVMKAGTVTRIPRLLTSETPFDSVRIGVRAWHTGMAPEEIPTVIGRLWYSQLELPSVTTASGPVHSIVRTSPLGSFN